MKVYEITFSPTGGTARVSDLMLSVWDCEKEVISLLKEPTADSTYAFSGEDICLIAVPSFGGRVPETAVERILSMKGNGDKAILVCVYGNRAYEDTLLELKNTVKEAGFCPVAAVAAIAEHSIMRQFAAGRPDTADEAELRRFAEVIWKKASTGEALQEVVVPGNENYRPYGGVPFKPTADKACNECGVCAGECPVGAIDVNNLRKVDEKKCISCMRCIKVCPQGARGVNKVLLAGASMKMAKLFETRKNNELFF